MAREFYSKNPTPPGAAQATSLGSISNTRNPTPPTHKEGQGESTEASKATRGRQRATRRRQREEGRTENGRGEREEATKGARSKDRELTQTGEMIRSNRIFFNATPLGTRPNSTDTQI